jgi:hypothetical protein
MTTPENNPNKRSVPAIIALSLVAVGALGSTAYLLSHQQDLVDQTQHERAEKDQALAEQRLAEGKWHEVALLLDAAQLEKTALQDAITGMERKLLLTDARAVQLERAANRNGKEVKELADLRSTAQRLREELAMAKDKELELRAGLHNANAEREALALQMGQLEAGARMVNNAEVDAVRGKKGKLTVKARNTKEVHMAFDLPEALAGAANYTITAPSGRKTDGASPVLSASHDRSDATASSGQAAGPKSARVNLMFKPSKKMEPGVHKIDVSTGKDYLQTVYLNLR